MTMLNDVLQLILNFYHSTGERSAELTDPSSLLPDGMGEVLQLAAEGMPAQLKSSAGDLSDIPPEELHKMLSFFVEKVLFIAEGNHYRVLGLNPGASPAQIRNHYKLLLHLFYLDRSDLSSEWDTERAMRINHAYSILRDQERRHAYDQDLRRQGFVFSESRDHCVEVVSDTNGTASNFVRLQPVNSSLPADITPKNDVLERQESELKQGEVPDVPRKPDDGEIEAERGAVSVAGANTAPVSSDSIARSHHGDENNQGTGEAVPTTKDNSPASSENASKLGRQGLTGTRSTRLVIESDDSYRGAPDSPGALPFWRRYVMIWGPGAIVGILVGIGIVMYGERPAPPGDAVAPVADVAPEGPAPIGVLNEEPVSEAPEEIAEVVIEAPVEPVVVPPAAPQKVSDEFPTTGMQPITFDFTADSWVEVTDARNEKLFINVGKAGESRTVEGVAPFRILLGNARGVVMKYNGQPYDHYVHIRKGIARFVLDEQPNVLAENIAEGTDYSSATDGPSAAPGDDEAAGTEDVQNAQGESGNSIDETVVDSPNDGAVGEMVVAATLLDSSKENIAGVVEESEDAGPSVVAPPSKEMLLDSPNQSSMEIGGAGSSPDMLTENLESGATMLSSPAVASVAPAINKKIKSNISLLELDDLVFDFMRTYEIGDLDSFIRLFSKHAHTNDRSDREGIEEDYRELFDVTEKRQFIISQLRWERGLNTARGEGDFRVNIQLKSNHKLSSYVGRVVLHVKKGTRRVLITRLVHEYDDSEEE